MAHEIQLRRDTAANWTSTDPTLAQGEIGYETDTNTFKIGDGATAWSSLTYFSGGGGGASAIDDLTDVDTSTVAPTDGQVLTWVDADSEWAPADSAGGGGGGTGGGLSARALQRLCF